MTGVYFLHHEDFIKIGHSRHIGNRIHSFNSWPGASVIGIIPCALKEARRLERDWHTRFRRSRDSGEWFHICPELMMAIQSEAIVPSEEDLKPFLREGRRMIGAFFPSAVGHQLRRLAAEQEVSMQRLLGEALNDLFQKNKLPEIVELDTL